jgi:CRISPR-associated protein Csm4
MKRQFDIIRFRFTTPLHLSNIRADYGKTEKMVHSDTLHAAVMQTMAFLGMSNLISKNPGWIFSSLFPFYRDSLHQYTYFFKKPIFLSDAEKIYLSNPDNYENAKNYKKVEYVDKEGFEELLMNGYMKPKPENIKKPLYTHQDITLEDIYASDVNPRIRKPRTLIDSDPEIFYMERIYFKPEGGLYAIVYLEDSSQMDHLQQIINYLGESGLGTDRNIGNGRFTTELDQIEIEIPDKANYITNLSLFLPPDKSELEEMTKDKSCWKLIKRGGWMSEPYNTYRKKSVYMFSEGSVFKKAATDLTIMGNTANLKPELPAPMKQVENDVYRVGKSIFLPISIT